MGLLEKKVSEAMLQGGVVSAPDRLTGTAAQNKAVFDRLMRDVVAACINPVLEELAGSGGAATVGAAVEGLAAGDVQGILAALKRLVDERYSKTEALAVVESVANPLLRDVTLDEAGIWTFTRRDGSTVVYDTKLEKVVVNFKLEGDFLVLEHDDGTTERVSLAAFRDHHGFADSETVSWTYTGEENDRVFTAVVRPRSVTLEMLAVDAVAKIDADVQAARDFTAAADASKTTAQAGASDAAASAVQALTGKNAAEGFAQQALGSAAQAVDSKNAACAAAVAGAGSAAQAQEQAQRAKNEADRAKSEADRAHQIVGGDFATKAELGAGVTEAKGYTDTKTAEAKGYADTKAAEALQGAKEYADPAGSAQVVANALTTLEEETATHIADKENPHGTSAAQIGAATGDTDGNAQNSLKLGGLLPASYIQLQPNILVNADFRRVINQRGKATYGGDVAEYTIDRWLSWGQAVLTVSNNCVESLSFHHTDGNPRALQQPIDSGVTERLTGKMCTLTLWVENVVGEVMMSFGTGNVIVKNGINTITAMYTNPPGDGACLIFSLGIASCKPIAMKLELGEHFTGWCPFDYATELTKCQRYQIMLTGFQMWRAVQIEKDFLDFSVELPTTLRARPSHNQKFRVRAVGGYVYDGFNFFHVAFSNSSIRFRASKIGHGLTDGTLEVWDEGLLLDAN